MGAELFACLPHLQRMSYSQRQGIPIYFGQSLETVGDDIREVQPTFHGRTEAAGKGIDKIMAKGSDLTGVRSLFSFGRRLAEEFELSGKSFGYNLQLALARKLIFANGMRPWVGTFGPSPRQCGTQPEADPGLSGRRHQYSRGLWPDRDLTGHLCKWTAIEDKLIGGGSPTKM